MRSRTLRAHSGEGYRTVKQAIPYGLWTATVDTPAGPVTGTGWSESQALYNARQQARRLEEGAR